jgi:ribonuclease-3
MSTSKTNLLKNNSKNDNQSDTDSSVELNDEAEYMIKADKKIYPVYNENNFYISKEIIQSILKKADIEIKINDLNLWQQAFIHKSYCKNNDFVKNEKFYGNINAFDIENNEFKHIMRLQDDSNEVIEWLGDGIIQSVVAIYLYQRYKTQREGFLTKIRSKLVKTETLSKLALYLNFDKYLIVSKHIEVICNGRKNSRILEDSFEAFVGALYNDFSSSLGHAESYNLCSKFIINLIEKNIDITELIINDDNYKDQLMRYYQKTYNGKFPIYEQKTLITSINDNGIVNKKFHMFVRDIDNNIIGEGIARSKKEAEQKAANAALKFFGISNGY